jgi:hypothetical protein
MSNETQNLTQQIAHRWIGVADALALNPKTKAYRVAHQAFLAGITHILGEQTPPIVGICMVSGRDIASLVERTQPR